MRLASTPTANLSYLLLAGYALSGRMQAIQAIALSWLFSMLNTSIAQEASLSSIGRYAVLVAAAITMIIYKRNIINSQKAKLLISITLVLGGFIAVHSLIFSAMPDVSLMKIISWTIAMTTLFAGWAGLEDNQRMILSKQLFALLVLVMLISLPMLALPLGYIPGSSLFKGVMGHSQALGLTMALLGTWATFQMLSTPKPSWGIILLTPLCITLIIFSGARTAAISLIIVIGANLMMGTYFTRQPIKKLLPGIKNRKIQSILFLLFLAIILAFPKLSDQSEAFLNKGQEINDIGLSQAYQLSRGALMDKMLENINKKPIEGIGFGIASYPDSMLVTRDPILGLPTSALIEKGVLPIAVVEEIGIIGFILFFIWVWIVLKFCIFRGLTSIAIFMTTLVLNMGEYTFFSSGGMGLLTMILIAWAATGKPTNPART